MWLRHPNIHQAPSCIPARPDQATLNCECKCYTNYECAFIYACNGTEAVLGRNLIDLDSIWKWVNSTIKQFKCTWIDCTRDAYCLWQSCWVLQVSLVRLAVALQLKGEWYWMECADCRAGLKKICGIEFWCVHCKHKHSCGNWIA